MEIKTCDDCRFKNKIQNRKHRKNKKKEILIFFQSLKFKKKYL
jgi:hypothetical protein